MPCVLYMILSAALSGLMCFEAMFAGNLTFDVINYLFAAWTESCNVKPTSCVYSKQHAHYLVSQKPQIELSPLEASVYPFAKMQVLKTRPIIEQG